MSLLKNKVMVATCLFCVNFTGASIAQDMIYKNQRGSTMELVLHPKEGNTGTITGTFTTAVGNCKTDIGGAYAPNGFL